MRHISKPEMLEALKQSFHDLENLKLISPADLDIIELRRDLKEKIAAIEAQQARDRDSYEIAA